MKGRERERRERRENLMSRAPPPRCRFNADNGKSIFCQINGLKFSLLFSFQKNLGKAAFFLFSFRVNIFCMNEKNVIIFVCRVCKKSILFVIFKKLSAQLCSLRLHRLHQLKYEIVFLSSSFFAS